MGQCSGQGMKTVERIVATCREFGRPIGPQNFLFDRQLKEWAAKNPEAARILQQTREAKAVEPRKGKAKSKQEVPTPKLSVEELQAQVDRLKSKLKGATVQAAEQALAQAKFEQYKKQKIADQVKSNCRLAHVKSVGNGL